MVPEAATLLITNGINPKNRQMIPFQKEIVAMQINNEDFFKRNALEIAKNLQLPPVMFCDRGILTGAAYLPGIGGDGYFYEKVLKDFGLKIEKVRVRYDAVIHMVTAADGAEEFYTLSNNNARTETAEEARALDKKTQDVWVGHPHLRVIPNVDIHGNKITFEQKINNVIAEVLSVLGYPIPLEIEEKYVLKTFDKKVLTDLGIKCEGINIEQTYLVNENPLITERVRKRTYLGSSSYFHTVKMDSPENGGRVEIDHPISKSEYYALLLRRDLTRHTIYKVRYCFLWKNQYFEVDVFSGHNKGLVLLEREKTNVNESTFLPDFLQIEKDVTNDKKYSNAMLALN